MSARTSALRAGPRRMLCSALTLSLLSPVALAPQTVQAAHAAPARGGDEAALEEARALFETGRAKYDTFDYDGAISIWQEAYAKVPESQAGVRNAMVYNIALAQEKAYEVDKDVAHLRQAVLLLESWLASYKSMFKKTSETETEVAKAQARIDELKARIGRIESGDDSTPMADDGEAPPTVLPPTGSISFDTGHNPELSESEQKDKAKAERKAKKMIGWGWASAGAGTLVGLIGLGVLGAAGDSTGALVGGGVVTLAGLGLIVTGGVFVGKGYKKRKAIARGQYTLVPYGNRQGGGAAFQMHF